jgi:hypothetical protein
VPQAARSTPICSIAASLLHLHLVEPLVNAFSAHCTCNAGMSATPVLALTCTHLRHQLCAYVCSFDCCHLLRSHHIAQHLRGVQLLWCAAISRPATHCALQLVCTHIVQESLQGTGLSAALRKDHTCPVRQVTQYYQTEPYAHMFATPS